MTAVQIKTELLKHCHNQVDNRYSKIKQTIAGIEDSLLEESKSSSGDKHETGRAMLQIDRENAGKQLQEIEKILPLLKKIDVNATSDYARLGSLVYTDRFTYFISLSIGTVSIAGADYLCVALNSPVGLLISGKKRGETFILNGSVYKIMDVK
ncbi:3-oxoacyl-ACP synthase [Aequorivita sp. SDUM287046]|uniref:3-oxoacyl-ACP synthase n=1 Tax=Aequorivita aurantiaca TaxID=3053356 RepID=A0ABT8DEB6_9FLAO|nr:3-oxoacyl-ACP synthase [Aequorivita aurantiaca]MDN3723042.1 3-oxoacyl-ACP synthase [Aequorivita aurantiaca]